MERKAFFIIVLTIVGLLGVSAIIMLFARGYVFSVDDGNLKQTGILSINSTPSSALIYVNNVPKDVTNNSITGLPPGTFDVRLEKSGYHTWNKQVEVKAGEVTNVQSLLISSFPEIKPLTITGARNPLLSPDGQKIVYVAQQTAEPDTESQTGIWLMDLTGRPFNILSQPKIILADTDSIQYSQGTLEWSSNSESLLIDMNDSTSYQLTVGNKELVTLTKQQRTDLLAEWQTDQEKEEQVIIEQFTPEVQALLPAADTHPVWSPDETKVMYTEDNNGSTIFKVLDLRPQEYKGIAKTPEDTKTYTTLTAATNPVYVTWYPDSRHVIVFEETSQDIGQISILEIEGTNKTSLFSGRVVDGRAFPHPDGSRIIFLTNFTTQDDQNNLYSMTVY